MTTRIRAKYVKGALVLLEPLELEEGREMMIGLENGPALDRPADPVLEMFERMRQLAPAETWDSLPADGANYLDHYLYGAPKDSA